MSDRNGGVATSTDIRNALGNHVVPVRVQEEIPFSPPIIPAIAEISCKHCNRTFKSSGPRERHIHECILNPKRKILDLEECPKCHVEVARRSVKRHTEVCDGVAEHTLERRQIQEDRKKRRAKAEKTGKPFERKNSGSDKQREKWRKAKQQQRNRNEMQNSEQTVIDKVEVNVNLEELISIMASRFVPVMGSRYMEFGEWADLTKKLWESV